MLDNLVGYLNNLRLGDVLLFCVTIFWAGWMVAKAIRDGLAKHKETVENNYKKRSEAATLIEDVSKATKEVEEMRNDLDVRLSEMQKVIDEHVESNEDEADKIKDALSEFNKLATEYIKKIGSLEARVEKMEKQIDLLFKSDKEYFKAFIMEGYNKYVKAEHSIDLISLQNLENIYNKFIEEDGGKDEFLAKLMQELRNLPTTKEKKRDD